MFKRNARKTPEGRPAIFQKKLYSLVRFGRDIAWLVEHIDDLVAVYVGGRLDASLREAIMVGVAYENTCRWCAFMHSHWAKEAGLTDRQLREATELEPEALSEPYRSAVVYARRRAADDFPPLSGDLDGELGRHFDARCRDLIEAVARLMTAANLTANTFDALLSRVGGEPVPHSRLVDELVLGGLFALGLPLGALGLAVMRGVGPLRLAGEFFSFSEAFDWRVEQQRLASVTDRTEGATPASQ